MASEKTELTNFGASGRVSPAPTQVSLACSEKPIVENDETKAGNKWELGGKLLVCFLAGIIFGICLEKGRVFEPRAVREQMVFKSFIMLKMFFGAVASGQLATVILSLLPETRAHVEDAMAAFSAAFSDKGFLTSGIGALILGIGMPLSGSCPGQVLAQIGAGAPNAFFTFFGAICGALAYGMSAPYIVRLTRPKRPLAVQLAHEQFHLPYAALALPMMGFLGLAIFIMEYFRYWGVDTEIVYGNNIFSVRAWPPSISGLMIGLLQVVVVLAIRDTLGGSSAFVTVASQWVVTEKLQEMFPYLAKMRCGIGNWWQVFYVGGAIAGGAISSLASGSWGSVEGVSAHLAFFGGFCLIFGSRLAGGCTSGHGLSGMGLLAWLSFIAVPCMFGGGIITAFCMQATGALDHYVYQTGHV